MPIKTEMLKKLICDNCEWECDNQECCPMSGKSTLQEIKELHPEFLWYDGKAYCAENYCSNARSCYTCGVKSHDELYFCEYCDEHFCDECAEKPEHKHGEDE